MRESSEFDKTLLEKENFELKRTIEKINEEHMNEVAKYLQKIENLERKLGILTNKENYEQERESANQLKNNNNPFYL